jgi:hypothetical protein
MRHIIFWSVLVLLILLGTKYHEEMHFSVNRDSMCLGFPGTFLVLLVLKTCPTVL